LAAVQAEQKLKVLFLVLKTMLKNKILKHMYLKIVFFNSEWKRRKNKIKYF